MENNNKLSKFDKEVLLVNSILDRMTEKSDKEREERYDQRLREYPNYKNLHRFIENSRKRK